MTQHSTAQQNSTKDTEFSNGICWRLLRHHRYCGHSVSHTLASVPLSFFVLVGYIFGAFSLTASMLYRVICVFCAWAQRKGNNNNIKKRNILFCMCVDHTSVMNFLFMFCWCRCSQHICRLFIYVFFGFLFLHLISSFFVLHKIMIIEWKKTFLHKFDAWIICNHNTFYNIRIHFFFNGKIPYHSVLSWIALYMCVCDNISWLLINKVLLKILETYLY